MESKLSSLPDLVACVLLAGGIAGPVKFEPGGRPVMRIDLKRA